MYAPPIERNIERQNFTYATVAHLQSDYQLGNPLKKNIAAKQCYMSTRY